MLTVKHAAFDDLGEMMRIYASARTFMKESGNATQWGDHFPPEELIREDIAKGRSYVVTNDGRICGAFAFIIGDDPTYRKIEDGAWQDQSPYGTIHRVASDGSAHGIFDEIVRFCTRKIPHLRIDTHRDNRVMRHLIERNGFSRCGIIHVADGTARIAYEKGGRNG